MQTGWDALMQWNKTQTGLALHDWINTRGQDSGRLREALREAWNSYGKADNADLVEALQADGYEVKGLLVVELLYEVKSSPIGQLGDVRKTFKRYESRRYY